MVRTVQKPFQLWISHFLGPVTTSLTTPVLPGICHISVIVVLNQSILFLISPIFFVDFGGSGCPHGTTKKAAMECPSPPLL